MGQQQSKIDRETMINCELSEEVSTSSVREMGSPANKAPIVHSVQRITRLSQSRKLKDEFGFSPFWEGRLIRKTYVEIQKLIKNDGTMAPPLDKLSIDCLFKAGYMTQWYIHTIRLWIRSIEGLDYGSNALRSFQTALHEIVSSKHVSRLVGRLWIYAQYGLMEKYLKWATASLWASALQQTELPPTPDFVRITKGDNKYFFDSDAWLEICGQCEKGKLNSQNTKIMITLTKDIYMTKNCSLPVEKSFVQENLDKHKKILCEPKSDDPLTRSMCSKIETAIKQCADDIFGPLPAQDEHKTKKGKTVKVPYERLPPSRIPSLGASVNFGRHKGGAAGDLISTHGEDYLLPEPAEGYLHSYCSYKTDVVDVRTPSDPELFFEAERSSRTASYARQTVSAQVVPLLEAFKVRTITKGDADQYHLARRWQKVIHAKMRKQQNCRLIGQPCNSAYLSQIFGNSPYFVRNEDGFFVSGDYESATDLLHPHLSEFANEAICQRLRIPLEDQLVLKQCLTGHELKYTAKGQYYKQQWGQLMGSPTSFPILCLINLAATKVAYEVFLRKCGWLRDQEYCVLEELPMCVNGDDILFWSYCLDHYEIWKEVTKQCGLKFSLGKNYTHKKVAIINSQLFFFHEPKGKAKESKYDYCEPNTLFSRSCSLQPRLLFRNEKTLNSRLICGGQRSTAVSGNRYENIIAGHDQIYLELLAEELDEIKVSANSYVGGRPTAARTAFLKKNINNSTLSKLSYLQGLQKNSQDEKIENLEAMTKWRQTIEQRGEKLLEMLSADSGPNSRPAMREAVKQAFNNVQISKLEHHRLFGLEKLDKDTPYFLPQSLGGLGLFPPVNHKFTIMEYLECATLEGCPELATKWLNKNKPRLPMPAFMQAVNHELAFLKKCLDIKPELKESEDLGLLRFLGEEDGFWEHSFLVGFLKKDNMITDAECAGQALMMTQNMSRKFKMERLVREKRSQTKVGEQLRFWKKVKIDGVVRLVKGVGDCPWEEQDWIQSCSILKQYIPSPKF